MTAPSYGALDTPYVRAFIRELAPSFLDHVAVLSGVRPPARERSFAWCDLGCGQGVTAVMLAAMHPAGRFYGIDMMPAHVDHGRRLARDTRVGNVEFHQSEFGAAADLVWPKFDYIVLHGVYSWVSASVRNDQRRFIDRHLSPGGLVYVSYNALPGRAADLPLQKFVQAHAARGEGSSIERVEAALQLVKSLGELKVKAFAKSLILERINQHAGNYDAAYLAHELLSPHWEPLCVTQVRAEMNDIGLTPVGSASLIENYDNLILRVSDRAALAEVQDPDLRELLRDFLIDQAFRRDVFTRQGARLSSYQQRELLLESTFGLRRQPSRIAYTLTTDTGRFGFDNAATRTLVAALSSGPRRLRDIARNHGLAPEQAIGSALMLAVSGQAHPTEHAPVDTTAFNAAVLERLNGPEEIAQLAMPFGTHIDINDNVRQVLVAGSSDASWEAYLEVHAGQHRVL